MCNFPAQKEAKLKKKTEPDTRQNMHNKHLVFVQIGMNGGSGRPGRCDK